MQFLKLPPRLLIYVKNNKMPTCVRQRELVAGSIYILKTASNIDKICGIRCFLCKFAQKL